MTSSMFSAIASWEEPLSLPICVSNWNRPLMKRRNPQKALRDNVLQSLKLSFFPCHLLSSQGSISCKNKPPMLPAQVRAGSWACIRNLGEGVRSLRAGKVGCGRPEVFQGLGPAWASGVSQLRHEFVSIYRQGKLISFDICLSFWWWFLTKLVLQFRLCKKMDAQIRKTTGACLVHQIVEIILSVLSSFGPCNNQLGKGAAKLPRPKWQQSSLANSV